LKKEPLLVFYSAAAGLDSAKADLRGLSGLYGIVCLVTGNIYVGSSIDLGTRLPKHFWVLLTTKCY
jgi:hypothetical protein